MMKKKIRCYVTTKDQRLKVTDYRTDVRGKDVSGEYHDVPAAPFARVEAEVTVHEDENGVLSWQVEPNGCSRQALSGAIYLLKVFQEDLAGGMLGSK